MNSAEINFSVLKDQVTTIDIERLKELSDFDTCPQKSLVTSAIDLFIQMSAKQMTDLENYKSKKDINRLYKTAHSLKSSCANIGANSLSHMCFVLETATRKSGAEISPELITLIDKMENELQSVRQDLLRIQNSSANEV